MDEEITGTVSFTQEFYVDPIDIFTIYWPFKGNDNIIIYSDTNCSIR